MAPCENGGVTRIETRSLVRQAKEVISEAIAAGSFPNGRLPPEDRLAKTLGVSRGTVREALNLLEADGIVARRRGVGTTLNLHLLAGRILLNQVAGFYELLSAAGFKTEIAWSRLSEREAPFDIAPRLACKDGESVLWLDRLLLANTQPAIHITEMVLKEHVTQPITASDFSESIFTFADRFCTRPIHHTVVELIPSVATRELTNLLPTLSLGDPFLSLIETHYTDEATPIAASRVHVVDKFVRFNVVRRRG